MIHLRLGREEHHNILGVKVEGYPLKPTENQWLEGEITFGMSYVEAKMSVSGTV